MRSMDDLKAMIHRNDGESPQETQGPAGEGTTTPSTALAGRQMTAPEQVKALARHGLRYGWRRFRTARQHQGGFINYLFEYQARSVHGQADYARSRRWVPVGHEDGTTERAGMAYHRWVSLPGTAMGQAWLGAVQHPSVFALAGAGAGSLFIFLALLLVPQFGIFVGVFAAAGVIAVVLVLLAGLASAALVSKEGHKS